MAKSLEQAQSLF